MIRTPHTLTGSTAATAGLTPSTAAPAGLTGSTAGLTPSTAAPAGLTGSTPSTAGLTGSTGSTAGLTGSTAGLTPSPLGFTPRRHAGPVALIQSSLWGDDLAEGARARAVAIVAGYYGADPLAVAASLDAAISGTDDAPAIVVALGRWFVDCLTLAR